MLFTKPPLLTDLYINAIVPPRLDSLAFYATRLYPPIHVPCGKIEIYKAAVLWDRFTNITDDFPQLAVLIYRINNQFADRGDAGKIAAVQLLKIHSKRTVKHLWNLMTGALIWRVVITENADVKICGPAL